LTEAAIGKYQNPLMKLSGFCEAEQVDSLEELTTEKLDQFRTARGIKPSTAGRELGILRMFFWFCVRRKGYRIIQRTKSSCHVTSSPTKSRRSRQRKSQRFC
jgi:site-specific recombinase XerD